MLGAILLDGMWEKAESAGLKVDDFSLSAHRCICGRIAELAANKHQIDVATVSQELERHGELNRVGGYGYVSGLTDGVPPNTDIAYHVRSLREIAARRRAGNQVETLHDIAQNPSVSATALAEVASDLAASVAADDPIPPRFSEEALALRFSRQYAHDLRYVDGWGRWMCWDGQRWREDATLAVFDRARRVCRAASAECGDDESRIAVRLAAANTVYAIEKLARSDRKHAATIDQWDADVWLLNTPEGTVDLRTGEVRGHDPGEYLTKLTAAGPRDDCRLWQAFLERITDGNGELASFLQRVVGYSLTGVTREHAIFFMYGTGANGKSVFVSAIAGVLGDYAKTAPVSTFTATHTEQHPTDLAGLRGARFVSAIETEDGRCWAEAKIKSLTGGDRISVRFMRQDFFEYTPQFKLIVAGNHKPGLHSVDEAIRRRLHLIPFTVTIPANERDAQLLEKLKSEYPGILRWAIDGCLAWQRDGLNPPAIVRKATEDYLDSEDAFGRWLVDRCEVGNAHWTPGAALFADWQQWCETAGERPGTQKRFTQALEARDFVQKRTSSTRGFARIGLKADMTHVTHSPVSSVTRSRA